MNFEKIIVRCDQLSSLAYCFEGALIESDYNDAESRIRMQNLFYVLLEQIELLNKEVGELNEHIEVCNAIFAVNRVDELKREIATLKGKNLQDA